MAAIKCRRCGKTIASSKRAAFPLATEFANGTWKHKAPCEPSKTPIWIKGQKVTVERLFSGAERYVMAAAEIRTVARVTASRLVLDDGSPWLLDGRRTKDHVGDGSVAKVRSEAPGDALEIERRALSRVVVSARGDVWSEVPIQVLRVIREALEAVEVKRAALAKGESS